MTKSRSKSPAAYFLASTVLPKNHCFFEIRTESRQPHIVWHRPYLEKIILVFKIRMRSTRCNFYKYANFLLAKSNDDATSHHVPCFFHGIVLILGRYIENWNSFLQNFKSMAICLGIWKLTVTPWSRRGRHGPNLIRSFRIF